MYGGFEGCPDRPQNTPQVQRDRLMVQGFFWSRGRATQLVMHPADEAVGHGENGGQCPDRSSPKIVDVGFKRGRDFTKQIPEEGAGISFRPPGVKTPCILPDRGDHLGLPEGIADG